MALLNGDIPLFRAFTKRSFYTHNPADENIYDEVLLFAVQCVRNKVLTFHGMYSFGMLRSRIPIYELYWKEPDESIPHHFRQIWDCFAEEYSVVKYDYLDGKRCEVVLKDGSRVWAIYMFTIDWFNNSFSNNPADYKCGHFLREDKYGGYLLQPNNRIFWKDANWITKAFPVDKKEIKVDKEFVSIESFSDRWISEDSDCYYYEMNKNDK